ncbi:GcrA family cell cycle regulator [Bradyrhizobium sp. C-145]|uniref:GcrA family cell cycle regulator n=1 Tax=Bradyrhizobium sp. C-145 TaxID=574727 RepID=UPI00201B4813|nr:GcrA family cell cycle regulator [Bradyrhizobium sp. C-145]UQR66188.1 GcrA family cell cycle regulator [Bradyrhizobium sp. C-145]
MAQSNEWSDKAETTLRHMFNAGASAALIADAVEKTRSAVCGKIKRLKLHRESGPIMTRYTSKPHKKPTPAPLPKFITEPATQPVSILAAKRHHCRAVLDQRDPNGLAMFCGARKVAGSPWCAKHKRKFVITAYVGRA